MRIGAVAIGIVGVGVALAVIALATGHTRASTRASKANDSLAALSQGGASVVPKGPGPHSVDPASLRARGAFRGVDGRGYTVFDGKTNDGANRCAVTVGGGFSDVVCDPSAFADSPVEFGESYSAGPGGEPVREWHLSGIARADVTRIVLSDSLGRTHEVQLSGDRAFFFELPRSDIARNVTAVSLLVYGANGALIKEVAL